MKKKGKEVERKRTEGRVYNYISGLPDDTDNIVDDGIGTPLTRSSQIETYFEALNKSIEDNLSDDDFQHPIIVPQVRKMTRGENFNPPKKRKDEKISSVSKPIVASGSCSASRSSVVSDYSSNIVSSSSIVSTSISGSSSSTNSTSSSVIASGPVSVVASDSAIASVSGSKSSSSSSSNSASRPAVASAYAVSSDSVFRSVISPSAVKKRVITIKSTVKNIWNPIYIPTLHDLVNTTSMVVTNTFSFIKYIFVKELNSSNDFDLVGFVSKEFFVEVFMSLIIKQVNDGTSTGRSKLKESVKTCRTLIAKHKNDYCRISDYSCPKLTYSQQIALYECTKIETAYLNNIKAQFPNKLCMFLNHICGKKVKADNLRKQLEAGGYTKEKIKEKVRKNVFEPCNEVKRAFIKKELPPNDILDENARVKLKLLLSMYDSNYKFQKDSIFCDIKSRPNNHFKAFYKLQELCESDNLKMFSCFPIRTTFIPLYMTIDAKIVSYHILKNKKPVEDKYQTWGKVVNLKKKAFKIQGSDKTLRFQGTLETDGVGVSVINQNTSTLRKGRMVSSEKYDQEITHIESLNKEDIKKTVDKCVLIDPGRRDILYCMKETSTAKDKEVFIFTKNNRTKCSRHFRYLKKANQPLSIKEATETLSNTESRSVNLEKFSQYIRARASVKDIMYNYYGNETIKSDQTYFNESIFEFRVDEKCNLYYGSLFIANISGYFPQPEDSTIDSQIFVTYLQIMLKQNHILEKLNNSEKTEVKHLSKEMLEKNQDGDHKRAISGLLQKTQLLPFRKMKFSSKVYYDQNDLNLVQNLHRKFGKDSILVIGDWSAPNIKFQEPTRNKGLITMLKKSGFTVYLMNEFKTSSYCPTCENKLETFKTITNPRPHQQHKMLTVVCHGLLRCKNTSCLQTDNQEARRKVWNRDQAAVLNFRKILNNLRDTGKRPVLFSRKR